MKLIPTLILLAAAPAAFTQQKTATQLLAEPSRPGRNAVHPNPRAALPR